MTIEIKKCVSKKDEKVTYVCFEIDLGYRVVKVMPKDQKEFYDILDMKPSEFADLPVGTIKSFKEVK